MNNASKAEAGAIVKEKVKAFHSCGLCHAVSHFPDVSALNKIFNNGYNIKHTKTPSKKTWKNLTALFDGLSQRYGLLNVVCEALLNRLLNVNSSKQNTNCNKANTAAFGRSNSNKIA